MNLTFEFLSFCEPRLIELEEQCKRVRETTPKEWERQHAWYHHGLKRQMQKLVGFWREPKGDPNCVLFSSEAYNEAYFHFVKILEF